MIIGYARVSSLGQTTRLQIDELKAAGCEKVYSETGSAKQLGHRMLRLVLKKLQPGDTFVVTRLDRLARSTKDLLAILSDLSERGIGFRSIHDHWADTSSAHGRLLVTVLGGMAEFERELLLARTSEGREAAKARGVQFGRLRKLTPAQAQWVSVQRRDGASCRTLGRILNVDHTTISRIKPAEPKESAGEWSPPEDVDASKEGIR